MSSTPDKRIRELEDEVRELKESLHALAAKLGAEADDEEDSSHREGRHENQPAFVDDVRDRVQRVLRGDSEESIETHIGTVWLSRLATFLTMTAVAVGARATFSAENIGGYPIGPMEKTGIGYAISLAFILYGIFARRRVRLERANRYESLFAEAVLGCGLAGIYFITYASFFVDEMRLFTPSLWALAPMFGCLVLLAFVSHWQKSQTVAGIAFFLAYYTVLVSSVQSPTLESLLYALVTCAGLAIATLLFHFAHPWLLLSWAALVASHGTYIWFFVLHDPAQNYTGPPLPLGVEETFFWLSNGFLYVCFVAISIACIINAWKTQEFRRVVAPMAGVNSTIFFCLTWFSIREHYLEHEWVFRTGIAVSLFLFALMATWAGPRQNYLFQVFVAKAIIVLTLALQAYLSGEKLLVALALEALGLGLSYHRSGIVIFKVLGLLLSGLTFIGALALVRTTYPPLDLWGYTVPPNWFGAVGVSAVFCVIAWFYEHFPARVPPEERRFKAQWMLADSALDVHPASFGIIHAAWSALLLLTITILDLGENTRLPYILMAEGLALAVLGVLTRTPQLDVASVLLLGAAHLVFYVFLWMPFAGFEEQGYFFLLTVTLAMCTFIGAFAWERYLRRIYARTYGRGATRPADTLAELEHHLVCSVPYLAATFLLTTLLARTLIPLHVPAAQVGLAVVLLFAGYQLRLQGVKGSGVLAAAIASVTLYLGAHWHGTLVHEQYYLAYLGLYIVGMVCAERLFWFLQRREAGKSNLIGIVRTGFVVVLHGMGVLGLYHWTHTPLLALALLGFGVCALLFGAIVRESRYRWAALFIMGAAVTAAFLRLDVNDPLSFTSFAASASVLLVASWLYSRRYGIRARKDAQPDG